MKIIKIIAATAGTSAVALGAFGAHALRPLLTERGSLDTWQTASIYHLIHAVALLAAAVAIGDQADPLRTRGWTRAAACWAAGITLFSGSLYVLALGGPRWLGPITPLGGVLLIAGWFLVAFTARRNAN